MVASRELDNVFARKSNNNQSYQRGRTSGISDTSHRPRPKSQPAHVRMNRQSYRTNNNTRAYQSPPPPPPPPRRGYHGAKQQRNHGGRRGYR